MLLPPYVIDCIAALEQAGYAAWCVGGCVRDDCLGLTPADYDLCTSALPEETEAVFSGFGLVLSGKKHGTVGVITGGTVVEITTFRTEGAYRDNRHPDWVKFVPNVEDDLARRDFTVNAMAWSPTRGYADPFGGRRDLEKKVLRAVGDPVQRFREDSLRILRGVRFAVRYALSVEQRTLDAMVSEVHLMKNLARERVFDELCKLLPLVTAEDLIRFAPILGAVLPPLGAEVGFEQHSPHHAFDVYTHTAYVTESVPKELTLRWAALLHDVGKVPTFTRDETGRGHFYGHAQAGAELADELLRSLKAPTQLREQVVLLIGQHMTPLTEDKKLLRRRMSRLGPDTVRQLLALQRADFGSKGVIEKRLSGEFDAIEALLQQIEAENACLRVTDLAVNGHDLMALGFRGRAVGDALSELLEQVLDEQLPNEKEALLAYIKKQEESQ